MHFTRELLGSKNLPKDLVALLPPQWVSPTDGSPDQWVQGEAFIMRNVLDESQTGEVMLALENHLNILFHTANSASSCYFPLRLAAALIQRLDPDDNNFLKVLELLMPFANPHVPWNDDVNASIVRRVLVDTASVRSAAQLLMPMLISTSIAPNLLKVTEARRKATRPSLLTGNQVSRLGGGTKLHIQQEEIRRTWKSSPRIKVLSMVWAGLDLLTPADWSDSFCLLAVSLILNVGDDHVAAMKLQACHLLQLLLDKLDSIPQKPHLLLRLGLQPLLVEFCKVCVHLIPPVTPVHDSLPLLGKAYQCMFRLLSQSYSVPEFIEVINSNILFSIVHLSHLSPRTAPSSTNYRVMTLLVQQLGLVTENYMNLDVLTCLDRVFFTLNQIISNPFVVENSQWGHQLLAECLECQSKIIQQFTTVNDPEALQLLSKYRYDLVGVWLVLIRRCELTSMTTMLTPIQENFSSLQRVLEQCGNTVQFESEVSRLPANIRLLLRAK